nr:MAG TPA: hypothetical protein [Siphoviridae sp. ctV7v5]
MVAPLFYFYKITSSIKKINIFTLLLNSPTILL